MSTPITTERRPTVWVVNDGGHDYSKAESWGTLVRLTEGGLNPFKLDRLSQQIAEKLSIATADDYLLISGLQIINGLCMVMWLMKFDHLNLLQWANRGAGDYKLVTLDRATLARTTLKDR